MVVTNTKRQPFYRSTGRNSGLPNEWLPFDGIKCPGTHYEWFDKTAYVIDPEHPSNKYGFGEYYRYGSHYYWEISQALRELNLPQGTIVESGRNVNLFLGAAEKYEPNYKHNERYKRYVQRLDR